MTNRYVTDLFDHYRSVWGDPVYEARWLRGPYSSLPSDFRVVVYPPTTDSQTWKYATCAMGLLSPDERVELHLLSPIESCDHVELLTSVVHYHMTGHPLDEGATVNFGRAWLPESACSYGLISRPYPFGPSLEVWESDGGAPTCYCYWLLPITRSERDYKKEHGVKALEDRFEQAGLEYWDPARASVI